MKNEVKTPEIPVQSYRSFLREILIEKQRKNPQLSLRSFAKTIGIQSSFLSMVLNGKRDLSEETAALISEKIGLSEQDAQKLNLLLRLAKAVTVTQRSQLLSDLERLDPATKGRRDLAVEQFKAISEWYHLPLQVLIDVEDFDWSDENAAKALGISVHEVREALERLAALELIELRPGKRPVKAEGRLMIESPFKSEALRRYHTQMLGKGIESLTTQTPEERFTGTLNLALDESQLKAARQVMKSAMDQLLSIAERRAPSKRVYHASFNLFDLTQNPKTTSKTKKKEKNS